MGVEAVGGTLEGPPPEADGRLPGPRRSRGRVYLYAGSATGPATGTTWSLESDQAGANFGVAVAGAGDVNGDGYDDLVVGANLYDDGSTDEGGAFVYLGGASGPASTPDWQAESEQASADFGIAVAGVGDVDGDGYDDIAVGATLYDNGEATEGLAQV